MENFSIRLGQRIRTLRQSNNLTQEKLAELADLNVTFIGHIERGTKNPTIETLNKISEALQVPLTELLKFNNSIPLSVSKEDQLNLIFTDFVRQIQKLYE